MPAADSKDGEPAAPAAKELLGWEDLASPYFRARRIAEERHFHLPTEEGLRLCRALLAADAPAYRRADQDTGFLERDEARGLRLNLEYLKPDLLLREHGVQHTIVVFGSTRFTEPSAARRELERLSAEAARSADPEHAQQRLRVARQVLHNSRYYDEAQRLGVDETTLVPTRRDEAVQRALKSVGSACFFSALTTVIGLFSLGVPPVTAVLRLRPSYGELREIVYEGALLVETGAYKAFSALIVVSADESVQRLRLIARDGFSVTEANARIEASGSHRRLNPGRACCGRHRTRSRPVAARG